MVTTDERMKILKMINEGKITAGEGAKLLKALSSQQEKPHKSPRSRGGAQWLRVRVTDMSRGTTKVNVNLPLTLLDAGMNIASQFAPEMEDEQMMNAIKEALSEDLKGKIVDVIDEEDQEHVEIFIE